MPIVIRARTMARVNVTRDIALAVTPMIRKTKPAKVRRAHTHDVTLNRMSLFIGRPAAICRHYVFGIIQLLPF